VEVSLAVRGIDFQLSPMKVSVDEVTLADFFSRLIVNPDGTLNMQRLAKKPDAAEAPAPKEPAKEAPKESAAEPPANVRLGKIVLSNGSVNFSDFFIKPNYSVAVTGVAGSVSEMTPDKAGDVELHGRIHQTAPLEILGRVNSLSKDLFVDMNASVKDIELPSVTPYSVKYTGYGIQKGKLSVKVAYHIENRKLAAENNVYLDQLTFGERVESPTATTLPVLFAVALMKDKNGVIDIDLPISGSLDDPEFSVGGIIMKALVNLLTKAVTAPFAFLGSLVGGGEELAYIEFAPGSSTLNAEDEGKLKTLAKALDGRPALKLEVSGRVDPDLDRDALKRAAVDREIKAAKLKDAGAKAGASIDEVAIAPDERDKYLTAAYKEAKFDRPPLKDLPPAEMEKLLLANAKVADDDLRQLANARAQAAKAWLVETGSVAAERVFIVSSKTGAEGVKDPGKPTRADFSLK
jgi:flagellar motor protein MotB